jgi:hypothetical protein
VQHEIIWSALSSSRHAVLPDDSSNFLNLLPFTPDGQSRGYEVTQAQSAGIDGAGFE